MDVWFTFAAYTSNITAHVLQNETVKRTQRFIPLKDWLAGEREAPTVDFSKIDKIPLEFFVHIDDEVMDYEKVLKLQEEISSPVKIRMFTHQFPPSPLPRASAWTGGRNTDRYYTN